MEYLIETKNLSKRFGQKIAVDSVNVHLAKGEIYGLIGKNGAGKTTLMKLLLGLANPSEGEIIMFGGEKLNDCRKKIGSLIEVPGFYKNESAFENLKRFAILSPASDEKINEILSFVGLADVGKKKAGSFSLGMKQRLGIAIALLGDPEILILDEPINGLDPTGIKEIRNIILKLNKKGVTFMISSHLLDELSKIATTYGIVNNGKLEEISAEELSEKCKSYIKLKVDDTEKAINVIKEFDEKIDGEVNGNEIKFINDNIFTAKLNKALVENGVSVFELKVEKVDFEDFFIEKVGK